MRIPRIPDSPAIIAIVVIGAAAPACSESDAASEPTPPQTRQAARDWKPEPAPALTWQRDTLRWKSADFGARPELRVSVRAGSADDPLTPYVTFHGVRYDTEITIGDHQVKGGSSAPDRLDLELPDPGSLRITDVLAGHVPIGIPVTVKLRGHEPAHTELGRTSIKPALTKVFSQVVDRPISFPGERETGDDAVDTAAILQRHTLEIVGTGETLSDIDWIVLTHPTDDNPTRRCSGYLGEHPAVTVTFHGTRAVLYDRRTGEKLAGKTHRPRRTCPRNAFVTDGGTADVHAPREAVETWVRKRLRTAG